MAKYLMTSLLITISSFSLADTRVGQSEVKKSLITGTTVIEDRGGQNIAGYLPKNNASDQKMRDNFEKRRSSRLTTSHFPVVSKNLSVGKVEIDEASDVKYQVAVRPIFIVGYDPVSIKWLRDNAEMLIAKSAIGMVVNVSTQQEMNELQSILNNKVLMQPIPGDNFAKELKIRHYPFYMDNQGVMR